jgi:hypothetical protein
MGLLIWKVLTGVQQAGMGQPKDTEPLSPPHHQELIELRGQQRSKTLALSRSPLSSLESYKYHTSKLPPAPQSHVCAGGSPPMEGGSASSSPDSVCEMQAWVSVHKAHGSAAGACCPVPALALCRVSGTGFIRIVLTQQYSPLSSLPLHRRHGRLERRT